MIKHMWVAECDLCGKIELAKTISENYYASGCNIEPENSIPDGWGNAHNKDFILCPECLAKIERKYD